jgi:uncharacterized protein YaiE (UPF0345 family)
MMAISRFIARLTVCGLFAALFLLGGAGTAYADSIHTFSGTVTNANGSPISPGNLNITSSPYTGGFGSAVLGSDGHFSISVPAGIYSLYLSKSGHQGYQLTQSLGTIDLTASDLVENLTVNTTTLHVLVKDSYENPVSGSMVETYNGHGTTTLYPGDPGENVSGVFDTVYTDGGGNAYPTSISGAVYDNNGGSSYVCATIAGSRYCAQNPVTTGDNSTVIIQQPPTHTFSGIVTNLNGSPISPGNLNITSSPYTGGFGSAVLGSDGHFSISVPAGIYSLYLSKSGHQGYQLAQSLGTIDLTSSDLVENLTVNTTTIHVLVEDSYGNPVSGSMVETYNGHGATTLYSGDPGETVSGVFDTVYTDASGSAYPTSIFGAAYDNNGSNSYVCATIAGVRYCAQNSVITGDGSTTVIQQPRAYTISGTITDQNANPLQSTVTLTGPNGTNASVAVSSDSTGQYNVTGLHPGTYTSVAVSGSCSSGVCYSISSTGFVTISSSDVVYNIQITRSLETISGRVTDRVGNPLSATLTLVNQEGTSAPVSVTTDGSGYYSLSVLSGLYNLTASTNYCQSGVCTPSSASQVIGVSESSVTQNISLNVGPFVMSGILYLDNAPVSGAILSLCGNTGCVSGSTGSDGSYSLQAMSGVKQLSVHSAAGNGWWQVDGQVTVPGHDFTQNLSLETAVISFTVNDLNGNPLPSRVNVVSLCCNALTPMVGKNTRFSGSVSLSGVTSDSNGVVAIRVIKGLSYDISSGDPQIYDVTIGPIRNDINLGMVSATTLGATYGSVTTLPGESLQTTVSLLGDNGVYSSPVDNGNYVIYSEPGQYDVNVAMSGTLSSGQLINASLQTAGAPLSISGAGAERDVSIGFVNVSLSVTDSNYNPAWGSVVYYNSTGGQATPLGVLTPLY